MHGRWLLAPLIAQVLLACGAPKTGATSATDAANLTDQARLGWIAKAARTLHGGQPLAPAAVHRGF